jgi:hypothetical protein
MICVPKRLRRVKHSKYSFPPRLFQPLCHQRDGDVADRSIAFAVAD